MSFPIQYILIFLVLLRAISGSAQMPNDRIDPENLNEKYLAHLIKIKIDSVRQVNNCKPLINDSILFVAAEFHSRYMLNAQKLTHIEEEDAAHQTPQLRAESFGAVNYYVGENVLKTSANTTITSKKGELFDTHFYGKLADCIVDGWVNSSGHFKNIITPEYQVTGVSVAYKDGKIYACQKFARVLYTYQFEESKSLFPYSDYTPTPVVASFAGIKRELIPHTYEWGLKHDQLEKCEACEALEDVKPFITLRYEGGNFILRIENSAYVQELIQDRKDGFAVEIVEYFDYACGNPEYYTKPSRRNGQLKTNGILLKPLYKDDLLKGFKNRKKKADVRYLPYIFGADSVKFFNRFSQFKMEKYDSEFYEIKLGKLPKSVEGLWAYNLAYIQSNQICRFDYFTNYCGETFMDTIPMHFLPLDTITPEYQFDAAQQSLFFTIPFPQNRSTFTKADIDPFITSLKASSYRVDSVHIRAFSSVEGDSLSNIQLQINRANAIVAVFQQNQTEKIPATITTENSWSHFYQAIGRNPKYRNFQRLSKDEIQVALTNSTTLADLEPILAEERKAELQLYVTISVSNANCESFAKKEMDRIQGILQSIKTDEATRQKELKKFEALYAYIHKKVIAGLIDSTYFASIEMPEKVDNYPHLLEQFLLYGYEFETAFSKNAQWMQYHDQIRQTLIKKWYWLLSPICKYDNAYLNGLKLMKFGASGQDDVQKVLDELKQLEQIYYSNHRIKTEIETVNVNLNLLLLHTVFPSNPSEASNDASLALEQVYRYYVDRDLLDTNRVLKLAKTFVFYMNINEAIAITMPYMDNPEILQYIIPLGYMNPSDPLAAGFFNGLIELSKTTAAEIWCPLFMEDCTIPFQAFDNEELRTIYCEKCGTWIPDLSE